MPQVHIVAYSGDLGHGAAHGAQMLSLMLGFGVVSRLASGVICDRIGGLRTLLLGSSLQTLALLLFLPFEGLVSLYVISAVFGLSQGGIVPAYAVIIREYFPPNEAGLRVSMVLTASLMGMALGGWMSGMIFDLTGSYQAAFVNGVLWNLLNMAIALWLLRRSALPCRPGPSQIVSGLLEQLAFIAHRLRRSRPVKGPRRRSVPSARSTVTSVGCRPGNARVKSGSSATCHAARECLDPRIGHGGRFVVVEARPAVTEQRRAPRTAARSGRRTPSGRPCGRGSPPSRRSARGWP